MKQCTRCGANKPADAFYGHGKRPGWRRPTCKDCCRAESQRRHAHVKHIVNPARVTRYANDPEYRAQHLQQMKTHYKRDPEWMRLQATLHRYGLTLDQYHSLQERQDFCCAICGDELVDGVQGTHIDHCHDTQRIRGLLCNGCNLGIGHFRERPAALTAAARYVAA